jgi:spermidine dehydrogenase
LGDKNYSIKDKAKILIEGSYITYLRNQCGLSETLISLFRQTTNANFAVAPDRVPAGAAWLYGNNAGFEGLNIDLTDWIGEKKAKFEDNYIHHFPDGNASIARLFVRKMIPVSAPGHTMEDIVLARFDYGKLDLPENKVRLRLSSTVVNVKPGNDETPAIVTYVKDDKAHAVKARHCIMACYSMAIPYLIPDIEEEQAEALASNVKAPLVYTNIALTNWRAFHKLGANEIYCSDGFHCNMALDFPVSMGGYEFSKSPDDPIILHMEYCPALYGEDLDETERMRMGRVELLELSFEEIERRTREQLDRILGPYGFDVTKDIAAITINRWPHGYAGGDDHKIARRTIGNVAIANSDASGEAMAQAAISMGYRAVKELL